MIYDKTWCVRECANLDCSRNKKHLKEDAPKNLSWYGFSDCLEYKEVKTSVGEIYYETMKPPEIDEEDFIW